LVEVVARQMMVKVVGEELLNWEEVEEVELLN
jgi:hypothetical protein